MTTGQQIEPGQYCWKASDLTIFCVRFIEFFRFFFFFSFVHWEKSVFISTPNLVKGNGGICLGCQCDQQTGTGISKQVLQLSHNSSYSSTTGNNPRVRQSKASIMDIFNWEIEEFRRIDKKEKQRTEHSLTDGIIHI